MIIHLFDDAQKVTVEEGACVCGAQRVTVEYRQVCLKEPVQYSAFVGGICQFCVN